jgi:antitoxin component of MazEF toxin-antitoxin module
VKFRTTLQKTGGNTTGFEIPAVVVDALGAGKRPPVNVTLNGAYSYRNTVAPMGGSLWIGVSAEHRARSGVEGGDEIEVELALDTAPREVVVPDDLAAALDKNEAAKAVFEKLSDSHKRQHVLAIDGAKAPETRARRIAKAIEMLKGK